MRCARRTSATRDKRGCEDIYTGGVERLLAWAAGWPIDVVNAEALERKKR
jgi:hypothetical protein